MDHGPLQRQTHPAPPCPALGVGALGGGQDNGPTIGRGKGTAFLCPGAQAPVQDAVSRGAGTVTQQPKGQGQLPGFQVGR